MQQAPQERGRNISLPCLNSTLEPQGRREENYMNEMLRRSWWMLAIRGVAALAFGILAIIWPDATLLVLVILFAAYALITAAVYIGAAVKNRTDKGWWLILLLGLVAAAAGVVPIFHPL